MAGNFPGGTAAERALDKSPLVILGPLTAAPAVFAPTARSKALTIVSLFLMGTAGLAVLLAGSVAARRHRAQVADAPQESRSAVTA